MAVIRCTGGTELAGAGCSSSSSSSSSSSHISYHHHPFSRCNQAGPPRDPHCPPPGSSSGIRLQETYPGTSVLRNRKSSGGRYCWLARGQVTVESSDLNNRI
ncbi:hypothetical protein Tco_0449426 [Tanacetum coccineum]